MRSRAHALYALACCSLAIASEPRPAIPPAPAPGPREADPAVTLPPNERQPSALYQPLAADGDAADWSLDDLNTRAAWKVTKGEGQIVAVLDTGAYLKHRDLAGQIAGTIDVTGEGADDINSHGTWCATHVVGAENGWGMVGHMPRAKVLVVKVLAGRDGTGTVRQIADGIRRAVDWRGPAGERVSAISMSLGGSGRDAYTPAAIAHAKANGVIVVAAAGNDGPGEGTVGFPGGYADVVCVAAHDAKGVTARFSSRGPAVFVTGPGVGTRAGVPGGPASPDGLFGTYDGTSMSTPTVAALALGWCAVKGGPADATRGVRFAADLRAACSHPAARDTATGYGKPDAVKLFGAAPKGLDAVTFTRDDFTPSGLEKLKLVNPRLDGLTFPLKP